MVRVLLDEDVDVRLRLKFGSQTELVPEMERVMLDLQRGRAMEVGPGGG